MAGHLWKPGQSGNPKGRPKADFDLPAICREHTMSAVHALVQALGREQHAVAAAQILLDRGYGRAPLVIEGADTGSLSMLHLIAARQIAEQMQALLAAGVKPNGANGHGSNGNGHDTIEGVAIDYTKPALE